MSEQTEIDRQRVRADRAEAACAAHESVGREIMAERDQARAACAEMRAELEKLQMGAAAMRSVLEWWQPRTEAADGRRRRALAASDAGKGFLPPEKARELEERVELADRRVSFTVKRNNELEARNKRLETALTAVSDAWSASKRPDWEGMAGAVRIARQALDENKECA